MEGEHVNMKDDITIILILVLKTIDDQLDWSHVRMTGDANKKTGHESKQNLNNIHKERKNDEENRRLPCSVLHLCPTIQDVLAEQQQVHTAIHNA